MKVVFINSANITVPEWMVLKGGAWRRRTLAVRFGAAKLASGKYMLIDTGYSRRLVKGKRSFMLKAYAKILRPKLVNEPLDWLKDNGLTPEDVSHVFITHFHADHICALKDFPPAVQFITSRAAYDTYNKMSELRRRKHGVFWELLPDDFEERLIDVDTLESAELPLGLGTGKILAKGLFSAPLPGHALGHMGTVWTNGGVHHLYGADAQWMETAIMETRPPTLATRLVFNDRKQGAQSAAKIKRFVAAGGKLALCHTPDEGK